MSLPLERIAVTIQPTKSAQWGAALKATLRELCVILDGSHRKWCFATLALFLLAIAGYVLYALSSPGGPRGGSVVGMLYGIAGSMLMIFAGLISLRKKIPSWPIGSAQTWLRGHIWLGLLSVPLILFHAAFRWGGPLEQVLLAVMAAVILSGLIDLGVQQFFPRQMTARVPLETFYAQIPYECRLLQLEGDVAVSKVCGPLPLQGDESVATTSRLKLLGVTGRQPLPAVYRLVDGQNGHAAEAAKHAGKPAAKTDVPAAATEAASAGEVKPLSAAEKIAAMRAAKAAGATVTAEKPSPTKVGQAETADKPAVAKMTAAEKIAAMRAAKAAGATATAEKPSPSEGSQSEAAEKPAAAKMTAAEKIAAMRAAKAGGAASSKPTAAEPTAAEAAEKPPAAKLSAAEKIAMMRAGKKPAAAAPTEAGEPSPPPAAAAEADSATPSPSLPAEQKQPAGAKPPMSAADKIAMMRSLKHASKPAAAEPPAEAASEAAGAAAAPAAQGKLTAAEKIAMMLAKNQPAAATAGKAEAATPPATAKPVAKKPVASAAKKLAAEKPVDAAAQKQAAEALEKFYLESVRPFLAHESRARGALASEVNAGGIFAVVGAGLPEDLRPVLDRLLGLCDKRRQLSVQERVHGAMHFWLFIHVPLSLALLGLGVAHAIMSVYY